MKRNVILLTVSFEHLHFAAFVCSILGRSASDLFDIVIASDDPRIKPLTPKNATFLYLKDVQFWKELSASNRYPYFVYLKFPAIEILSHKYDKILYLDNDIFIATPLIGDIFEIDLKKFALAAVRDSQQRFNYKRYVNDFKLNGFDQAEYFNSGVLLINCSVWKQLDCSIKLKEVTKYPYSSILFDQTLLNLTFHKRWLELSPAWNWMESPLLNLFGDYMGVRLIHQKSWQRKPSRVSYRFVHEYNGFIKNSEHFREKDFISVCRKDLLQGFLHSLILNLRWFYQAKKWIMRFSHDLDTKEPDL